MDFPGILGDITLFDKVEMLIGSILYKFRESSFHSTGDLEQAHVAKGIHSNVI